MKKFKQWLIERFLPVYLREDLLREIARLEQEKAELREEIGRLNSYIAGLEAGIRAQRRIVINSGEVKK